MHTVQETSQARERLGNEQIYFVIGRQTGYKASECMMGEISKQISGRLILGPRRTTVSY